ncbi:DNA-binding transcriptional regulator, MarR family [Anaerocolumna xylanovorans DSM 12503]|uniref:DNA-binding transcriptional regulator, MarR family n=1 Tax=Anaerocolumna xylanovorans DSM 12503 TaxID=1121345 RepID=A0A1M7Y530_9FIRM|nr:MarR family transcriptional regulator [Anaerocolumna xylanovorans]SHO47485.1 DNA-binding transcriptional regulator, MarR family [Anaerocolumna xylanovorans DSM 12503]
MTVVLYSTILYSMEVEEIKTYGGFLISQIKQLQGRAFEKMLKESGIDAFNGAQGRILYVLWERESLTISEIGHLTSLAKTTLTGMLDRMEESGLVERTADKKNRRQVIISITDKARRYKEEYDSVSERMNELFYKGFKKEEVDVFEDMLRHIIGNLEE